MVGVVIVGCGGLIAALAAGFGYRAACQRRVANKLGINTPSGIAESGFVKIGGVDQWIQVRGEDRANPILLFVHGAGLSMTPFTPLFRAWEAHFTVVQWDRRGAGKTLSRNGKRGSDEWTFELLAQDGIEVAEYLCRRLRQEKVILLGHSQGSIVATLMAAARPELFYAYVGTGQVADMQQNEALTYRMALERADASKNQMAINGLNAVGPPPYGNAATWMTKQRWSFGTDPEMQAWQRVAPRMVLSAPGLSIRDVFSFVSGFMFLAPRLFAETMACTARYLGTRFDIPFYVIQGESDYHTLPSQAKQFVDLVDAPRKGFTTINGGGHLAVVLHADPFLAELRQIRPWAIVRDDHNSSHGRTQAGRHEPRGSSERPRAGAGEAAAAVGRRPRYRTWIRSTRLAAFAALSGVCLAGSVLSLLSPWFLLFLVPFALFGYIAVILALTVYRFAPRGGDIQRRIHDLIVAKAELPASSRALDVGCGSGSLVVKLARASADSTVTGVDSWGRDWEYSKDLCEDNARIEGVSARTAFVRQSGAALGFANGSFDGVVSCLTFHEIGDVERKSDCVVEALRVLRPGGRYAFIDLFGDPAFYPSIEDVREAIGRAGASIVEFGSLADSLPLPFPLRHPKVLGHAMLIVGMKPGIAPAAS